MEQTGAEKLHTQTHTESPISKPVEKTLESGIPERESDLGWGANEVILIDIKDDGKGVFKPKDGENHVRDSVSEGTYYRRERAAYLVDLFLDLDLVPPTVIREINNRVGSIQQFVEDAQVSYQHAGIIKNLEVELAVLDYIIWNSDRHRANYLVKNDGSRLYAIDNGLTFGPDDRASIYALNNSEISDETTQKLTNFSQSDNKAILSALLEELIGTKETELCLARIKKIATLAQQGEITTEKFNELQYDPTNIVIISKSTDQPVLTPDHEKITVKHQVVTDTAAR